MEAILEFQQDNRTVPRIMLLSGDWGTGKTILIRYLTEKWGYDPLAIFHLCDVEFFFYIECRWSTVSSFDKLLRHSMKDTLSKSRLPFDEFMDIILSSNVLVVVDEFDEIHDTTKTLVQDIINLACGKDGKLRVLLTTRPTSEQELLAMVPKSQYVAKLLVKGLSPELHEKICQLCGRHNSPKERQQSSFEDDY